MATLKKSPFFFCIFVARLISVCYIGSGDFKRMAKATEKTTTENTATVQPLAQMTVKATGADARDCIRQNKQVFLVRIYGEATAVKTKESRAGDAYSYLIGMFRAVRPAKGDEKTDQVFEAEKLFLPGAIQEKLEALISTGGNKPVQFGYDLFATPDSNVTAGYRYAAASIIESQATDRLKTISETLTSKALPTGGAKK